MHLTRLSNLLKKTSKGHYTKNHAIALKELASQSVGINDDTLSLQILQSIEQIEMYTQQISKVEASINEIMDHMDSVIKTSWLTPVWIHRFISPVNLPLREPECQNAAQSCYAML